MHTTQSSNFGIKYFQQECPDFKLNVITSMGADDLDLEPNNKHSPFDSTNELAVCFSGQPGALLSWAIGGQTDGEEDWWRITIPLTMGFVPSNVILSLWPDVTVTGKSY